MVDQDIYIIFHEAFDIRCHKLKKYLFLQTNFLGFEITWSYGSNFRQRHFHAIRSEFFLVLDWLFRNWLDTYVIIYNIIIMLYIKVSKTFLSWFYKPYHATEGEASFLWVHCSDNSDVPGDSTFYPSP